MRGGQRDSPCLPWPIDPPTRRSTSFYPREGSGRIHWIIRRPSRAEWVPEAAIMPFVITDPCIGWEDSVELLDGLAAAVKARRKKGKH